MQYVENKLRSLTFAQQFPKDAQCFTDYGWNWKNLKHEDVTKYSTTNYPKVGANIYQLTFGSAKANFPAYCGNRDQCKFYQKWWLDGAIRPMMIFDLTHNFDLIGKSREAVHHLLGPATFNETSLGENARKEYLTRRTHDQQPFDKFDWYHLDQPTCMGRTFSPDLEIVYQNNQAVAWRIMDCTFQPNIFDCQYSKSWELIAPNPP